MLNQKQFAKDLLDFISASPTSYHVVRNIKAALLRKKFTELSHKETWHLRAGGKYFISLGDSSIVAFQVGKGKIDKDGFRIIAAHTDSPGFKLKPNPEKTGAGGFRQLTVEPYGGMIVNTWFDRPLSLAGRVALKSENVIHPEIKFINFKRPLMVIPNVAIHLNRAVNEGIELNKQNHVVPIFGLTEGKQATESMLLKLLANELNVSKESIIDFDLFLYDTQQGQFFGAEEEFISSGKLDNLAMVHAGIDALIGTEQHVSEATNVMVCFDNEEVGSKTKQGAGSPFLRHVLERIVRSQINAFDEYYKAIDNSFMISADMAHAVHPNYAEKHDPNHLPKINGGPVIKYHANQQYTTDGYSAAVFQQLCEKVGVPVQKFVNRSDSQGGSTLGNISTSQIELQTVDVGNPMLAMHSIREMGGVKDHYYMKMVFEEFYRS